MGILNILMHGARQQSQQFFTTVVRGLATHLYVDVYVSVWRLPTKAVMSYGPRPPSTFKREGARARRSNKS